MKPKKLSRAVLALSLVSLLTDVASEMLYPVMPLYLRSIGYSALFIGILEGIAEMTAGLSKGYFGNLSDAWGKRLPFVRLGYALSALSKPMPALLTAPAWIFSARALDRLGKGIRTGARDALLSDEATPQTKGAVFGFHRGADTLGAALGPAFALALLWWGQTSYETLFLLAFFPGAAAVGVSFLFLREKRRASEAETPQRTKPGFFDFARYWRRAPQDYRRLLVGMGIFAVANSSDALLLLMAERAVGSGAYVVGAYILYNLVYAFAAYPLGAFADKIGLRTTFVAGLVVFAIVYAGMALAPSFWGLCGLFALYGVYAAATEGVAKAWISNVVPRTETATAIGLHASLTSAGSLAASALAGALWTINPAVPFSASAALALCAAAYFVVASRGSARGASAS